LKPPGRDRQHAIAAAAPASCVPLALDGEFGQGAADQPDDAVRVSAGTAARDLAEPAVQLADIKPGQSGR